MDASDCSFSDFWIVCVSVIRAFESDEEHEKCYELIDEELFPFLNGDDEVIKELQEKDLSIANQSDYIWKYGHYPVYHNTDVAFYADASQGLEAQLAELKKQNILFLWSTMQSSRRNRLSGF